MPKILINEIDNTNPGTPADYSNYSVLLTGFMGRGNGNTITPDSNGVYEFSFAQDFEDTIGLVSPHYDNSGIVISHYGNQMAYELLNLGYSVLYLPIKPEECVEKLTNANTWEIFKDKASYDFRFVSHGLLESTNTSAIDSRISELHIAIATLNEEVLDNAINTDGTNDDLEITDANETGYAILYADLTEGKRTAIHGLKDIATGEYYSTCRDAVDGILDELRVKNDLLKKCVYTATINEANANIANLAKYVADETTTGRGDCIALIEVDENAYVSHNKNPEIAIIDAINEMSSINEGNGKYCAMTVPSVVYNITDYGKDSEGKALFGNNKKFPGSFHYLACFMSALRAGFAEWYAAAGYTRGVSSFRIDHTTATLGEIAINALEPRNATTNGPKFACNVIANFRGSYYLWGNRTAHPLRDANSKEGDLVASHFLNIRQLCISIKKQLYVACRRFTFDPNSDTLWFNFVNAIRPTLEVMKADHGIRDYKIVKVYTDKKATLKARIRIVPIEAVEDFDLTVSLEDSFGETTVNATESI